jgi:alkylhydroperoxidase/carboxymuconolactone decarboxylase family protein YurZ
MRTVSSWWSIGGIPLHGHNGHPGFGQSVSVISSGAVRTEGCVDVDYTELLRRLAINDARFAEVGVDGAVIGPGEMDARTLALVRIAALVAVGGAVPSFGAQTDAAVSVGATAAEIVDVLVGVIPVVGLPRVVAAAPKLAMALGYDTDDDMEPRCGE